MVRELLTTCDGSEIETAGVVMPHGRFVVSIVFINQYHSLNGVGGFIELSENFHQIVGDFDVAHDLSQKDLSLVVAVKQA